MGDLMKHIFVFGSFDLSILHIPVYQSVVPWKWICL